MNARASDSNVYYFPGGCDTPSAEENTRLLLLDFRSGEAVCDHPHVRPLLEEGWCIRSAAPRVTGSATPRLLVVLTRSEALASSGLFS